MLILIIIVSYIVLVFLVRYLDIKLCWKQYQAHYKSHIEPVKWILAPIGLVVYLIDYLSYKVSLQKLSNKRNFFNWFFVDRDYRLKEEKWLRKEFEDSFSPSKKKETRVEGPNFEDGV